MTTGQTEAQRLAELLEKRQVLNVGQGSPMDDAAALLLSQDELLKQAFMALDYIVGTSVPMDGQQEQCWPSMKSALTAVRAHLEAK